MTGITILGSTGSIGVQALEVMEAHGLRPLALAAKRSAKALEEQTRCYKPYAVCLEDVAAARELKTALADTDTRVLSGREGVLEIAAMDGAGATYASEAASSGAVLNAMVGMAGLEPSLAAINAGKKLLLANKEALVCGGSVLMEAARKANRPVLPVDSEHSAIFQCLQAGRQGVKRLHLTASGGPFRGWSREQLRSVTPDMALRHPNWNMGPKVTCDSALLLNKGLELLEARWLFDMPPDRINVVVHLQSIVHSLVEYEDGALLAQLGAPDMRVPIQYALLYPRREPCPGKSMDLATVGTLTFEAPDREAFPCLGLAYRAAEAGGTAGAAFNAAAECAVEAFLNGKCAFLDVPERIAEALARFTQIASPTLEDILNTDRTVREMQR